MLRYDPVGRLYEVAGSAGTTRFLYDGDALVAEYDTAGTVLRRYIHGADLKADDPLVWHEGAAFDSSNQRFLRTDHQGSVVIAANASGVQAINRYDEYGIPQSGNAGRFQYTGQAWLPELGMYYYKARMYSPTLGRFMQTDPIGYEDGINWYAYVGNDPVNKVDFDGQCAGPAAIPCIIAGEQLAEKLIIVLTMACIQWCPRIEPPTIAPPSTPPAPQGPTTSEAREGGDAKGKAAEPKGAHDKGARPSTEDKHDKANARRGREQARAAEAKPKRGTTSKERQEKRKKYKKSEDYLKPKRGN